MDINKNNLNMVHPQDSSNKQVQETNGEEIQDLDFLTALISQLDDDDEISVTINQSSGNASLVEEEIFREVDIDVTNEENGSYEDNSHPGIFDIL